MTDNKTISRITNFLNSDFSKKLGKISIFKNYDGSYEFFDKYIITERGSSYEISLKNQDNISLFSTLKIAVAWCVHDNLNKLVEANRIKYLDMLISGSDVSMEMHMKMLKHSKNVEKTLIHVAKLKEEKIKKSNMLAEMDKFIQSAKYLQIKNFIAKDK